MTIGPTTIKSGSPQSNPQAVRESAQQFEALLIAQLLKSARAEDGGETESIRDMAEQQLAEVMSRSGGLGLATLICEGLRPRR